MLKIKEVLFADELQTEYGIRRKNLLALRELMATPKQGIKDKLAESGFRERLFATDDGFWTSLAKLALRPWFSSLWTFQEILLARDAHGFCGDCHVNWTVLLKAAQSLQHIDVRSLYLRSLIHQSILDIWAAASGFANSQGSGRSLRGQPRWTMSTCLQLVTFRKATDPRDLVYGVLDLMPEETRAQVLVDYSLPEAAVYKNAMHLVCGQDDGSYAWIKILENTKHNAQSQRLELPSWCPDFTQKIKIFEIERGLVRSISKTTTDAVGQIWAPAPLSVDANRLAVLSFELDTVQESVLVASTAKAPKETGTSAIPESKRRLENVLCEGINREWLQQIDQIFLSRTGGEGSPSFAWLDHYARSKKDMTSSVEDLRIRLFDICKVYHQWPKPEPRTAREAIGHFGTVMGAGKMQCLIDWHRLVYANRARYFFITEAQLVGFARSPLHAGDRICYFPGGTGMHAVSAEGHRYLAQAEIHSLIDGFEVPPQDSNRWVKYQLQ